MRPSQGTTEDREVLAVNVYESAADGPVTGYHSVAIRPVVL